MLFCNNIRLELVVIAIIAILAGMLMPALSKARDKAIAISCVNNLKQVGIYVLIYCNDNKNWYPTTSQGWGWGDSAMRLFFNREPDWDAAGGVAKTITQCPGDPLWNNDNPSYRGMTTSGINNYGHYGAVSDGGLRFMKLDRLIKDRVQCIMADDPSCGSHNSGWDLNSLRPDGGVHTLHNNGTLTLPVPDRAYYWNAWVEADAVWNALKDWNY